MSRPKGYRPVVWLRRFLLVALVAFLGIVVGLLIQGRSSRGDRPDLPDSSTLAGGTGAEIRSGKGFSHEVTEDGEPRYRISASSWSATRDEKVRLEDVSILFNREGGTQYTIEAASGIYQQSTATATLLGGVLIESGEGLRISGPGFELQRRGTIVSSTDGPVEFRYQDRFEGTAREMSTNLRRKQNEISGNVQIRTLAGEAVDASLSARKLVFEQEEAILHAEGGVELRRGGSELTARRLSLELNESGEAPRFVRARWEVEGSLESVDDGVPQTLRFVADEMSVLYDLESGEPAKAELENRRGGTARLDLENAAGETQRIESPYLVADFADGVLARADVLGPVALSSFLSFDPDNPLVSGCADSAEARFTRDGELAVVALEGDVVFHQTQAQISGDVLEAKTGGDFVVTGKPARIYSARAEFLAPEILYRSAASTGSAQGGVRATLESRPGFGLLSDGEEAREPIQVTAQKAAWSASGESVVFRDQVRAWQDENFLVADRLEVATDSESMKASGRVKTVVKRTDERDPEASEVVSRRAPIEVTAAELEFDGEKDVLRYSGGPKARQAGRTLSCNELDLELDDASEVERMICTGNAFIESPDDGQTVRGERALYLPGAENVEVSGNPVVLRNADGRQVTGARVLYDFKTGRAQVLTGGVTNPPEVASSGEESE